MKRLRDELDSLDSPSSIDPKTARAARVLSALRPLDRSEARLRRVRAALDRPARHARITFALRFAIVAILLLAGAAASAAVGRALYRRFVQTPPISEVAPSRDRASKASQPTVIPIEIAKQPVAETAPEAPPPAGPPRINEHAFEHKPSPRDPAASVRQKARAGLEAATVVDAVNALHRDHDPARARMLLTYYLDRHPDGAVAEEALALAIEAAADAKDPSEAAALAARYLTKYPQGRFCDLAARAEIPDSQPFRRH